MTLTFGLLPGPPKLPILFYILISLLGLVPYYMFPDASQQVSMSSDYLYSENKISG